MQLLLNWHGSVHPVRLVGGGRSHHEGSIHAELACWQQQQSMVYVL
jgi:hypothetical protein